jgi:hypothetical protein
VSEDPRDTYLAVDRREQQLEFLKRWGKDIPGHLAGPRPREIRPPAKPTMDTRLWGGHDGLRVLVCRASHGNDYNEMVVDADGSCATQNHRTPAFHVYHVYSEFAGAQPVTCAIRCPNSLSEDEWLRVMSRDNVKRWIAANPKGKKQGQEPDRADW